MEIIKENSVSLKYVELYKFANAKTPATQEKRKTQFLENLRLKRNEAVNQNRNIVTEISQNVEEMDTNSSNKKKKKKKKKKMKLMNSEWLTRIPCDLEENWLVKLYPIGARRLVIAKNKSTTAYNSHGKIKDKFSSCLPGASRISHDSRITVLDCIYNYQTQCYFVLDVLVWSGKYVQECQTDFRFFLINSKLNEMPELRIRDEFNHRSFVNIEGFCATRALIEENMTHWHEANGETIPLEGLLFYHKGTTYVRGENPLVRRLKPHMLPNFLNVTVPNYYLEKNTNQEINENFVAEDSLSDMLRNMEMNN